MSSNANTESQQNLLNRPRRLHHAAWATRNQEATRQFYEDVVGLPMTACWSEKTPTGREYCHTFFEIGDGGAVVFFQWADQDENRIELKSPGHLALECDAVTQQRIKGSLEAAGYETELKDHGYCVSLYVFDPNNLRVEFTIDHPDVVQINTDYQSDAHGNLKRWLSGDHQVNNDIRNH
jgi:glyoxylase I family protein